MALLIKSGSLCQKAWIRLPSPPGVGVLELEERSLGCGFGLGDESLIWLRERAEGQILAGIGQEDRRDAHGGVRWVYNQQGDKPLPPNTPSVTPKAATPCL